MSTRSHFDGRRFVNPWASTARGLGDTRKMLSEPRARWPESIPVMTQRPAPRLDGAWATVTFIGHSTFLVQTPLGNIITDPVFAKRASPLQFIGPRRVRQPAVRFDDLPPIAMVLLSHNHYDHCDLAALRRIARRFDPLLLTPLGNGRLARRTGFTRIEELDWWQSASGSPVPVTVTPARHFSARTPFDRNRALWGSFVVDIAGRRLFFGGDSGYAPHFADIRRRHGAMDLSLLPIGAYEPRWFMQTVHMNPAEAVQAHIDLGSRQSVGMHFGTFQLTAEGIDDPLVALEVAKAERAIPSEAFLTLDFGASLHVSA